MKRGLGRGLDALLGDVAAAKDSTSPSHTLPIEHLQRARVP